MAHCFSECTTMALVIAVWTPSFLPISLQALEGQGLSASFSSVAQSCLTLCDTSIPVTLWDCSAPGFPVHRQVPGLARTHVHRVGDAIQPSHPLSSPSPPAFNLSQYQGLYNESVLHIRWPKYWSFSFSISPSNEYSGLFPLGWTGLISL